MSVTLTDSRTRLNTALSQARHARHHPDCRCGHYKNVYCTEAEWSWSEMVNRLITQVLRESQ